MSDQFWLSKEQLVRIEPYFPLSHGVSRVDDRKVISGIIHVIRNGFASRQGDAGPLSWFAGKPLPATADKRYDSDAYPAALIKRGIAPCIPPRAKRKNPATYCKTLYKQRHKVENMFAKLKDRLSGNGKRIAIRSTPAHMLSYQQSRLPS